MKVLVVWTSRTVRPAAVMPYGACIVAEAAARAGHEVKLLDLAFSRHPLTALNKALCGFRPQVTGFSVRNIDNNDLRNPCSFSDEVQPYIRAASHAGTVTIIGGAAVGIMPEEFLRSTGADYAVPGEGETAFPAFLNALENNGDARKVPGVAFLEDGIYRYIPPEFERMSRCFTPDYGRWTDIRAYRRRGSTVPLQTKRGCPFRCVYCTYAIKEGADYRLVPPQEVVDAVKSLVARGARDIEFVDNVFNSPCGHAVEICRRLAVARHPARFHSVEINPAFVNDDLLRAMEAAGFAGMGITAESAHDAVLQGLGKNFTRSHLETAVRALHKIPVPILWMFLLGGPGETEATACETFRFAARVLRRGDAAFFNIGIRIYPGTLLEKIARAQGVLSLPREQMLTPVSYISPSIDFKHLESLLEKAVAGNRRFIDSRAFSFPVLPLLSCAASFAGIRPPLWKYTGLMKRPLRLLGVPV